MGLILDTNALSAIAEGDTAAAVKAASFGRVSIPVIVLGEYRFGIAQSRHKRQYERWLEEVRPSSRILDIGEDTAEWYAAVRGQLKMAGTPIPSNDIWIAALCRQHSLPLLSRDRHFDLVKGLQRIGW
jgi:tRNA(fMet)-specific endonuclease VapC